MMADEVGISEVIASTGTNGRKFSVTNNTYKVTASGSLNGILFDNDLITFDATQKYDGQTFQVQMVDSASGIFNLTDPTTGQATNYYGTTASTIGTRRYGGRGTETTSELFCETDGTYCDSGGRLATSGSVQAKMEALDGLTDLGVEVSRYGPGDDGGYQWLVTFLDPAPEQSANDFSLSLNDNSLKAANGTSSGLGVTLTKVQSGETYSACSSTALVVPSTGAGLVNGQVYYARVTAINSVGYSLPQAAGGASKPMTTPGPPTSVVLSTVSASQLRVQFSSPTWDGGDEITSYMVEYATSASFLGTVEAVYVTYAPALK